MNSRFFIGLDDTDFDDSIGTGAFSRELALYLNRQVAAVSNGITRHQFCLHPDIPYSSHNSSACIEVMFDGSIQPIVARCKEFIEFIQHPGADPGLCIAAKAQLSEEWLAFARLAKTQVVTKEDAFRLAERNQIYLSEHGGEGIGVIGALCGCALRMSGTDGRFISLKGIREIEGEVTIGDLKKCTPIQRVIDPSGDELSDTQTVMTNSWVRPDLVNNTITLRIQRDRKDGSYFCKKEKQKGTHDLKKNAHANNS